MRETPLVSILTFCQHPALAYGTLLAFKTLRVGFPTARVEVFDNGSHHDVAGEIARAAADVGATFTALRPRHYADHYQWLLRERDYEGALVLVDPDVVFWRDVEGWDFGDALAAGRLIPAQRDGFVTSLPRLHPSLFCIPSVRRLRAAAPADAVGCSMTMVDGVPVFSDTLAPLYAELAARCHVFGESELDCYDHLFHGSHLPLIEACNHAGFGAISAAHVAAATGDLASIRGVWRAQAAYLERDHRTPPGRHERMLTSAQRIQHVQGVAYPDLEIANSMQGLGLRMSAPRRPARKVV